MQMTQHTINMEGGTIRVKLEPGALAPTRATEGAAGFDLYAWKDLTILPYLQDPRAHQVPLGISLAMPPGVWGDIRGRSGLVAKNSVLAHAGVIDSDYRGMLAVVLFNFNDEALYVRAGQRVAQLVFSPYVVPEVVVVAELDATQRGVGGFGSTGQ